MIKLKAAIAGLGRVGWEYDKGVPGDFPRTHLSAYLKRNNVEIVAVCDPEILKLEAVKLIIPKVKTFCSYEEMLNSSQIDVLSICTPTELHFDQVVFALNKKISMIWLEKPAFTSVEQHKEILSRQHNSRILVNYIRRYSSNFNALNDLLKEGKLGLLLEVRVTYSRGLIVNGTHAIDYLCQLLDWDFSDKATLSAFSSSKLLFANKDLVQFHMQFNETKIDIIGINCPHHLIEFELFFTNGRAGVYQNGEVLRIEESVPNNEFPGFFKIETKQEVKAQDLGKNFDIILCDLLDSENEPKSSLRSSLLSTTLTMKLEGLRNTDGKNI